MWKFFVFGVLVLSLAEAKRVIPVSGIPVYYQCGESWSNDTLGGGATICEQGCAMCSIAMHLAGRGVVVPGEKGLDPGTFNSWLKANHGYVCIAGNCNNLNLTDVPVISPHNLEYLGESPKPNADIIGKSMASGQLMITAHVRHNSHFVAVVGYDDEDENVFYVNDPNRYTDTYHYDDISDLITYALW